MGDDLNIEIHRAKDIIIQLKEIRDFLPFAKINEGAREYINIRVEDCINLLKEESNVITKP